MVLTISCEAVHKLYLKKMQLYIVNMLIYYCIALFISLPFVYYNSSKHSFRGSIELTKQLKEHRIFLSSNLVDSNKNYKNHKYFKLHLICYLYSRIYLKIGNK